MEDIVARWEWRTFAQTFGAAEERIRAFSASVRESSELYVLSMNSRDNTKLRDGRLDIKSLVRVNRAGLEQWRPVLKAAFPLQTDELRQTIEAWQVEVPESAIKEYSHDDFLGVFVGNHPRLRTVRVFKERHGYTINDCTVELANLTFNDEPIRTLAVEHENPEAVLETVRMLELDRLENINYVAALKKAVGMS